MTKHASTLYPKRPTPQQVILCLFTRAQGCSRALHRSRRGFKLSKYTRLRAPLTAAVLFERTEIVESLLKAGADPVLSGNWYWGRPLAIAVEINNTDIVKLLINHSGVGVNCHRHEENFTENIEVVKAEITNNDEGSGSTETSKNLWTAAVDANDSQNEDGIPTVFSIAKIKSDDREDHPNTDVPR